MRTAFLATVLSLSCLAQAQFGELLKRANEALNQHSTAGLSNDKIVAGLKEALQVSTRNAVAVTGKPDGFLKNAAIKILLPPKLQRLGNGLRMFGMGARVDELEVGMNRAAEQATPEAKQIFIAAVRNMSFDDEFDLNKYVVAKTLDGLFLMLGEEEKKIRKNPAAQTTALLKEVFGRK